jgi:hypothetical protein
MVGGLKKKAFHHPIDSIVIKLLIGTTSLSMFAQDSKKIKIVLNFFY